MHLTFPNNTTIRKTVRDKRRYKSLSPLLLKKLLALLLLYNNSKTNYYNETKKSFFVFCCGRSGTRNIQRETIKQFPFINGRNTKRAYLVMTTIGKLAFNQFYGVCCTE